MMQRQWNIPLKIIQNTEELARSFSPETSKMLRSWGDTRLPPLIIKAVFALGVVVSALSQAKLVRILR